MNIGVVIANHNYDKYLKRAIDSAINQTVKPKVITICDDCSTDNSWNIISEFISFGQTEEHAQESSHGDVIIKVGVVNGIDIIAVRFPISTGPSEARNFVIGMIVNSVDIISILDADDEFLPNKLEECIKPFSNPQIGVVYANYYHINEETSTKIIEIKQPYDIVKLNQECIVHSGALIRTRFLEMVKDQFGYYDRTMRTCEDFELWHRLKEVCLFYHVPLALTNVLVHSRNSTNSVDKSIWEKNWQRIKEKHFQ